MLSAAQEVERLISQIRIAAPSQIVARASDRISVLCAAYMAPTSPNRSYDGVRLSTTELRIMDRLFHKPNHYVSTEILLNAMYFDRPDGDDEPHPDILRVYISRLRNKLKNSRYSIPITEGYGLGYRGLIADAA